MPREPVPDAPHAPGTLHGAYAHGDRPHPGRIPMSPRLFLNIMHRTFRAADRTREAASLGKGDMQIQPLLLDFEGHVIHHPRQNQTQGQG